MTPDEAADGRRLSRAAGWNQTLADWSFLLQQGIGIGFRHSSGTWVASLVALPLGSDCGWISMVLTDPAWRRRGLAKRLMEAGLEVLTERGLDPVLDATPAGETVYRQLGFSGDIPLGRWVVKYTAADQPTEPAHPARIRPVRWEELDPLAAWDAMRSGCDRAATLRYLATNRPDLAWVAENESGENIGYILGRTGDRRPQLGPLVAADEMVARDLLRSALASAGGPVYLDAFARNLEALQALPAVSWDLERGFNRMRRGPSPPPGDAAELFLAAGPELG